MSATGWTWAELTDEQLKLVTETEQALGADYLLVYRQVSGDAGGAAPYQGQVRAAQLTDDQLGRLRELEDQVHGVVVAYTKD